jgi:anaerobic selenocysteine-containing dehydrogenase
VLAPVPDVLAWLAKLAARFDVELSPYASNVFDEISDKCFGGISYTDIGERASLPAPAQRPSGAERTGAPEEKRAAGRSAQSLRLVAYRPLFSGPAVERTPELQFQRPSGDVQISREDAKARGIRHGQKVTVSSNGTSVELRAQVARDLAAGIVRVAAPDAGDLHATVEVKP